MLDPTKRDGFDNADAKFLEIIDKFGWHVMSVAPRVDTSDKQEWFSYSTGLYREFRHPEIIMCGLSSQTGSAIINEIGGGIKSGKHYLLDCDYTDIFAYDLKCRFRLMHPSQYGQYVCFSQWFYEGDEFPVWQCFWPDQAGRYPWEPECDPETKQLQPLLYIPIGSIN